MFTPDRNINPDSFYLNEEEEVEQRPCANCQDLTLDVNLTYAIGYGFVCNYCKVHILKIKQ